MNASPKTLSLIGAALIALGASAGAAAAMPVAPVERPSAGVEQVAGLHRYYPGYNSRSARMYRHARRKAPNRYCRNQPSRCR